MKRVVFYCEARSGLGHVARSVHLCKDLRATKEFSLALISSFSEHLTQSIPADIQQIEGLPPMPDLKAPIGDHIKIITARIKRITSFCREWQPHCLIIDHFPLGISAELLPVFDIAAREHWDLRFAAGVPYLEGVSAVSQLDRYLRAYRKYSIALGYTEQSFDPVLEDLSIHPNLEYQSYIGFAVPAPSPRSPRRPTDGRKHIMVFGGSGFFNGPDFFRLIFDACRPWVQKQKAALEFIAGPAAAIPSKYSFGLDGVTICPRESVEKGMAKADIVIARCGYNTSFTVIQGSAPVIFMPASGLYDEQINRARKLARLDRVWNIEEGSPISPRLLARAVNEAMEAPFQPRRLPFTMNNHGRLASFLNKVL